jgi:hypothetical protein
LRRGRLIKKKTTKKHNKLKVKILVFHVVFICFCSSEEVVADGFVVFVGVDGDWLDVECDVLFCGWIVVSTVEDTYFVDEDEFVAVIIGDLDAVFVVVDHDFEFGRVDCDNVCCGFGGRVVVFCEARHIFKERANK